MSSKKVSQVLSRRLQSAARLVAQPVVPHLPEGLCNRAPWLGRVSGQLPDGGRLWMQSDGPGGKCYIARKIAGRAVADYEPETLRVYLALLRGAKVVLDIGANTGIFALTAAALDAGRQVFAFEPVPHIAQRLRNNVDMNHFTNLTVCQGAVGREPGEISLHIPATRWSLPTSASTAAGLFQQTCEVRVPLIQLDHYISAAGLATVDVVKIDTETTEHDVLAGATQILRRHQPAIIAEVLPDSPAAAALPEIFHNTPYRTYRIDPDGLVATRDIVADNTREHRNYLFITPKRLPAIASLLTQAAAAA